jgi:hypothetical protein
MSIFTLFVVTFVTLFSCLLHTSTTSTNLLFISAQQPATTTSPECICKKTCEGPRDPLTPDAVFEVSIWNPVAFDRYAFRRAVGTRAANSQWAVVDKGQFNSSFRFSFTPYYATIMSSDKVCRTLNQPLFLDSFFTCCLQNTTVTEAPSSEDTSTTTRSSHMVQLIICWVSIGLASLYLIVKRSKEKTKDFAMDSALDLATQKDDDEE